MIEMPELLQMLDYVEQGVLVVGARALLLHVNRTGSALLAAGDGIVTCRGAVGCRSAEEARQLGQMLEVARRGVRSALAVHRPAKPPLTVLVTPLGNDPIGVSAGPMAALLVSDPGRETTTTAVHLRDLYGFTPAESRIALGLLDAASLQDMAARLAVSINAVRVHLRHLFEKTGTRRQAELVRLLLAHRLPPDIFSYSQALCRDPVVTSTRCATSPESSAGIPRPPLVADHSSRPWGNASWDPALTPPAL